MTPEALQFLTDPADDPTATLDEFSAVEPEPANAGA